VITEEKFLDELIMALGEREGKSVFQLYRENYLHLFTSSQNVNGAGHKLSKDLELLTKQHYPVQYLIGKTWFYDLEILIREGALIPRPETEELVDYVLQLNSTQDLKILDIGTGSGCIALALKKHRPKWHVVGLDASKEALIQARRNAEFLNLDVQFIYFDVLKDNLEIDNFDIVVSNPPYIDFSELQFMSPSTLRFEPEMSLFSKDPMAFYHRIFDQFKSWTSSNAKGYFEINEFKAEQVLKLAQSFGFEGNLIKDMSGKYRILEINNPST
jgi:release factor glutamine methyltransferase